MQFQATAPRQYGCIGRVPRIRDIFAGAYGAAGFYCNVDSSGKIITDPSFPARNDNPATVASPITTLSITPRGSQLKSDWNIFTNLSAVINLPVAESAGAFLKIDVFNAFNQKNVLDLNEIGTQGNGNPRGDYGYPTVYQTPRSVRFEIGFKF
jgi:hypothetical protein